MKTPLSLPAIIILCNFFSACSKNDTGNPATPPTPPLVQDTVAQDTLLSWQKTKVSQHYVYDIAFLNPAQGFYIDTASLYSSSDSGKTWTQVPGVADQMLNLFLLNGQGGFVQGITNSFVTSDFIHWSAKKLPSFSVGNLNPNCVQLTSAATGYISISSHLYKTTDTFHTWNSVLAGYVQGMFFFNDNEGIVYTINTTSPPYNFFHTSDGGASWQPLSGIPGNPQSWNVLQFTDRMHGWFMRGDTLYASTDGGVTWLVKRNDTRLHLYDVQFINNLTGYLADGSEILKTTDGGQTWVRNCKVVNGFVFDLFFLDEKTGWAGCTDGSLLRLKL